MSHITGAAIAPTASIFTLLANVSNAGDGANSSLQSGGEAGDEAFGIVSIRRRAAATRGGADRKTKNCREHGFLFSQWAR